MTRTARKARPFKSDDEQIDALKALCWRVLQEKMPAQEAGAVVDAAAHALRPDAREIAAREAVAPLLQGFARVAGLVAAGRAPAALDEWFTEHGETAWAALRPGFERPVARPQSRTEFAGGLFIREWFTSRELAALYILAGADLYKRPNATAEQILTAECNAMSNTLRRHGARLKRERQRLNRFIDEMLRPSRALDEQIAAMRARARAAGVVVKSRRL